MIKVTPCKIPSYNIQNLNTKNNVYFQSNIIWAQAPTFDSFSLSNSQAPSPLRAEDKRLSDAVSQLSSLKFEESDVKHVQSMGVVLPFLNGADAVKFIKDSKVTVKFATLPSANIHAQYSFKTNSILINDLYKDTKNPAEILAISEAILHEAGHAKDQDGTATIQEEIDCLAMNALAHRTLNKEHPDIFAKENSLIVKDGVCVYAELFFDNDPSRTALIERLKQKYGFLPAGSFKHAPSSLALEVKSA